MYDKFMCMQFSMRCELRTQRVIKVLCFCVLGRDMTEWRICTCKMLWVGKLYKSLKLG